MDHKLYSKFRGLISIHTQRNQVRPRNSKKTQTNAQQGKGVAFMNTYWNFIKNEYQITTDRTYIKGVLVNNSKVQQKNVQLTTIKSRNTNQAKSSRSRTIPGFKRTSKSQFLHHNSTTRT
jgi:hypothetical protein